MRVRHGERGTALAETTLTVGLTLMIVFNALELAMLGFGQLHADAAAYAVARLQALTGSATTAESEAASALPPALDGYTASTQGGISQATATKTAPNLVMLGAALAGVQLRGVHQELVGPSPSSTFTYSFAVPVASTYLPNWFAQGTIGAAGAGSPHNVYLAQYVDTGTNAQGWNGIFAEWRQHEQCLASLNFPPQYSQTQDSISGNVYVIGASNAWSTFPNNSAESAIYGWDAGKRQGKC